MRDRLFEKCVAVLSVAVLEVEPLGANPGMGDHDPEPGGCAPVFRMGDQLRADERVALLFGEVGDEPGVAGLINKMQQQLSAMEEKLDLLISQSSKRPFEKNCSCTCSQWGM